MFKKLEDYLQEIAHYLPVKGTAEILSEIRSHILEKTEQEFGPLTEDSIARTIAAYGSPQKVAQRYMEGYEIISPTFQKHLFLYTAILFSFHFTLSVFSLILKKSMIVFPFFYIPRMDSVESLFYLPMSLVFDFGLVAIFLSLITQKKKEARLPWPKFLKPEFVAATPRKPKILVLVLSSACFSLLLWTFLKFQTVFFITWNFRIPKSLLNPEASVFYSVILLVMLACEIISYVIRLFKNSEWIRLVKNTVILLLFWVVWNIPVETRFVDVPGLSLKPLITGLVILLTILAALDFLKSLIRIWKKSSSGL